MASCLLPNTWSDFTPTKIQENMASEVVNTAYAGAEKLDAVMSTFNIHFSDSVIASVFPDTLIFYILLLTAPIVAVVLRGHTRAKARCEGASREERATYLCCRAATYEAVALSF